MSNQEIIARECHRFPWILKNFKREQVVYDGDQNYMTEAVEPYTCQRWYEDNKGNIREVKTMVF